MHGKRVVTRWFAATLTVLGLFVVLNITLYASDYFTGDGINDAVLYTLTNSLTGAGIGKYILPGVGVAVALVAVFGALGWVLRRRRHHPHHVGYSLAALLLALASVDASPAFHQISELVKSQSREGDPDFAAYYKEPSKQIDNPQLNWSISMAKVSSAPILITTPSPTSPLSLAELKLRPLISAIPCSCRGPITLSPAWSPHSAAFRCSRRSKVMPQPQSPASFHRIFALAIF